MPETLTTTEPLPTPESLSGTEYIDSLLPDDEFFLPDADERIDTPEKSEIASDFASEMELLGFKSKTLEGENNPLPDLVKSLTLIDHDTLPNEPTVRLYRGVRPTDGKQIAHQVGYLLKKPVYGEYGHIDSVDLEGGEVFDAVEAFSENPSYRNLMDAANAASMSESNRQFVDDRIRQMRRYLVQFPSRSLVDELSSQHVAAPWGVPTQDLSPFVATSLHPEVAAQRGGNTLMILDVPVSEVAGLGESGDSGFEVLLTGSVKPEWITATAELHPNERMSADTLKPLIHVLGNQEATSPATLRSTELHRKSEQNHQDDLREVNHDLIEEILNAQNIDASALRTEYNNRNINTYKDALWAAADYYLKKIQAMGRRQNEDVHTLYQYDDVTFFEKPMIWQPDDNDDDLIIDDSESEPEPKELNIKEVENLAGIYANLARIEEAYAQR